MELYNSTLTYQLRHAFENTKNEPFNVGVDSVHHWEILLFLPKELNVLFDKFFVVGSVIVSD